MNSSMLIDSLPKTGLNDLMSFAEYSFAVAVPSKAAFALTIPGLK